MKNILVLSKNRKWYINLLLCLISLVGVVFIPTLIYFILKSFINNTYVCNIISDVLFIVLLVSFYYKDLIVEFKNFKNNFKKSAQTAVKYYAIGIMAMVFFNLIIVLLLKNISTNENQVREMLYSSPITTMISIMLIAPISEELIFRKSIRPLLNNKYLYVIISGLLFGGAHLLTNILGGTFVIKDLIYLLPYGSLGAAFALMDYDTDSTFTSICMHSLHNTGTGIMLLIVYFSGAM